MTMQATLFDAPAPAVSTDADAISFLINFARVHRGESFSSEQVTISAKAAGIIYADARRWGSVFTQAAREGVIRRSDVAYRRQFGNGSLGLGWRAA